MRVTDRQTGQTDRQTEISSQYRVCITCSAVKIGHFYGFIRIIKGCHFCGPQCIYHIHNSSTQMTNYPKI